MNTQDSVFDYDSYRTFLKALVGPKGKRGGERSEVATAIGCHSSYLTKVLDGVSDLSLEQSIKLVRYLKLRESESEFLLLLVQQARAGSSELREYFAAKLSALREKRLQLKERVSIRKTLSKENQSVYYSSWRYAAIHMALTVEKFRTRRSLANYFAFSEERTQEILDFLTSVGLAEQSEGTYRVGVTQLHLAGDSPNILKHHTNLKLRALVSLDENASHDVHYSGVVTVSTKTAAAIRERLVAVIQEVISQVTQAADEEEVCCLGLDWFSLRQAEPRLR